MDLKDLYGKWVNEITSYPVSKENKDVDILCILCKPRLKIFSKMPMSMSIFGHRFTNRICYKITERKKMKNAYPVSMGVAQNVAHDETVFTMNFSCDEIEK